MGGENVDRHAEAPGGGVELLAVCDEVSRHPMHVIAPSRVHGCAQAVAQAMNKEQHRHMHWTIKHRIDVRHKPRRGCHCKPSQMRKIMG